MCVYIWRYQVRQRTPEISGEHRRFPENVRSSRRTTTSCVSSIDVGKLCHHLLARRAPEEKGSTTTTAAASRALVEAAPHAADNCPSCEFLFCFCFMYVYIVGGGGESFRKPIVIRRAFHRNMRRGRMGEAGMLWWVVILPRSRVSIG